MCHGNDSANILAEHVGGTIEEFVKMMNEKAIALGCKNTHFANPNGLDNSEHYSCAYDLAIMYMYAYNNLEEFKSLVSSQRYTLPISEQYKKDDRFFVNTNRLIINQPSSDGFNYFYEYCTGGKTGYTSNAKNCLVASAKKGETSLICAILGAFQAPDNSSYRYKDAIELFEYGFKRIVQKEIVPKKELIEKVSVINSKKEQDLLEIVTADSLVVNVDSYYNDSTMGKQIEIYENLTAPINSGDKVGTATYTIYDIPYSIDLVANNSIEKKPTFDILKILSDVLIFLLRVIVILAIIIIIVRINNLKKKKSAKKQRIARAKRYNARFRK